MRPSSHRRNKSFHSGHKLKAPLTNPMPGASHSLLAQAKHIYHSQGDIHQALPLFQEYLSLQPADDEARYMCAVAYLHANNQPRAIQLLQSIRHDWGKREQVLLLIAMAEHKMANIQKSMATINQALAISSSFEEALCFRGKLYLAMQSYSNAYNDFQRALHLSQPTFPTFIGMADCLRLQQRPLDALQFYNKGLSMMQGRQDAQRIQIRMKMAVCWYALEKWKEVKEEVERLVKAGMNTSEGYYYLGMSQIKLGMSEQGALNLQYCLRVQTNVKMMRKAFKQLICIYLQANQLYECTSIVALPSIKSLQLPEWCKIVDGYMYIIKGQYQKGKNLLEELIKIMKDKDDKKKIRKEKSEEKKTWRIIGINQRNDKCNEKSVLHNQSLRLDKSVRGGAEKSLNIRQPQKKHKVDKIVVFPKEKGHILNMSKDLILPKSNRYGQHCDSPNKPKSKSNYLNYFSSKSVSKVIPKIDNLRARIIPLIKEKKDRKQQKCKEKEQQEPYFTPKQIQCLYAQLLLFKGYAQFFMNNFMDCLDTYEEYEQYIKDMFGREGDITYNKSLCEGLLMMESGMEGDAIEKMDLCVREYFDSHTTLPLQPIVYKAIIIIKLAIGFSPHLKIDKKSNRESHRQSQSRHNKNEQQYDIYNLPQSSISLLQSVIPLLSAQSLSAGPIPHYYIGLSEHLLYQQKQARDSLELTLKLAEECTWKYLYVKGVVEMWLGNWYEAVKELTAGMILDQKPQLYICRCISFLMLADSIHGKETATASDLDDKTTNKEQEEGDQQQIQLSSDNKDTSPNYNHKESLIESSFQDLQKYIQLESSQQQISIWVSRVLFHNKAFDQAKKSLSKIQNKSDEMHSMEECIEIYDGEFTHGGAVGQLIARAFQGIYLSKQQQEAILLDQNRSGRKNKQADPLVNAMVNTMVNTTIHDTYLHASYEKWLVILHLYCKSNYTVLLRYLQKHLFQPQSQPTLLYLKYNVAILHYLMGENAKAEHVVKSIAKGTGIIPMRVNRLLTSDFQMDQCIGDVGEDGIKLLSQYLPYRPIYLKEDLRIYVKPIIPFPQFPKPELLPRLSREFLLSELSQNNIEKKIIAPWIRKCKDSGAIQFTQKLQESLLEGISKISTPRVD